VKWASAIVAAAACVSAPRSDPRGGPRGLHASEHLAIAHAHDAEAGRSAAWPEMRPDATGTAPDVSGVPWLRSWDSTAEHERIAAAHRGRADAMQLEYEEACGTRSREDIARSPLERYGLGGWPTSTGVIVYLSPAAGPPDHLLSELRCHRAWMMLAPAMEMDACPLDLPGLVLDARGDDSGVTLSITVHDLKLVDELHRRAALELEVAARTRAGKEH
jgi:hypothetical protein